MMRNLSIKDIDRLVILNRQELPGFLTDLGEEFLKKYYIASLHIPQMKTIVEIENEQIIGFATFATRVKGLYFNLISKDFLGFIWLFLRYFITHPRNIIKVAKSLSYPGFRDDIPELLTIAVDNKYQKGGIGRKLFENTVKNIGKKGFDKFRISTYERLAANGFYLRMGCKLERSFPFLGQEMNYYIYQIPISLVVQKKAEPRKTSI